MRSPLDTFGGKGEANQEFKQISHIYRKQSVTTVVAENEIFH